MQDTPTTPWSIKGVSTDARKVAKEEAAKAGMTMGDWLTARIQKAVAVQAQSGASPKTLTGSADMDRQLGIALRKMEELMGEVDSLKQTIEA